MREGESPCVHKYCLRETEGKKDRKGNEKQIVHHAKLRRGHRHYYYYYSSATAPVAQYQPHTLSLLYAFQYLHLSILSVIIVHTYRMIKHFTKVWKKYDSYIHFIHTQAWKKQHFSKLAPDFGLTSHKTHFESKGFHISFRLIHYKPYCLSKLGNKGSWNSYGLLQLSLVQ